jgi:hypothetical protein
MLTPATSRQKSDSTMEPVLTQVESVDIGDKEIETTYTKFTEAISVKTAGKNNVLCLFANMMHNIGRLEKVYKTSHEAGCDVDRDEEGHDDLSWGGGLRGGF